MMHLAGPILISKHVLMLQHFRNALIEFLMGNKAVMHIIDLIISRSTCGIAHHK